jgi:hypothetical protein
VDLKKAPKSISIVMPTIAPGPKHVTVPITICFVVGNVLASQCVVDCSSVADCTLTRGVDRRILARLIVNEIKLAKLQSLKASGSTSRAQQGQMGPPGFKMILRLMSDEAYQISGMMRGSAPRVMIDAHVHGNEKRTCWDEFLELCKPSLTDAEKMKLAAIKSKHTQLLTVPEAEAIDATDIELGAGQLKLAATELVSAVMDVKRLMDPNVRADVYPSGRHGDPEVWSIIMFELRSKWAASEFTLFMYFATDEGTHPNCLALAPDLPNHKGPGHVDELASEPSSISRGSSSKQTTLRHVGIALEGIAAAAQNLGGMMDAMRQPRPLISPGPAAPILAPGLQLCKDIEDLSAQLAAANDAMVKQFLQELLEDKREELKKHMRPTRPIAAVASE